MVPNSVSIPIWIWISIHTSTISRLQFLYFQCFKKLTAYATLQILKRNLVKISKHRISNANWGRIWPHCKFHPNKFSFPFFTDVEYLKREALAAKLASTSSKISFCDTTLNFTIVLIYILNVMIQNVSL